MPMTAISLAADDAIVSEALGTSLRRYGFALVCDHGIDPALIARGWELTKALFALPEAEKRSYHNPRLAGARGYTPFGTEIAKGAQIHDLKEFWHIGRDGEGGSQCDSALPPNVWPARPEGFRETFERLYAAFDHVGVLCDESPGTAGLPLI